MFTMGKKMIFGERGFTMHSEDRAPDGSSFTHEQTIAYDAIAVVGIGRACNYDMWSFPGAGDVVMLTYKAGGMLWIGGESDSLVSDWHAEISRRVRG